MPPHGSLSVTPATGVIHGVYRDHGAAQGLDLMREESEQRRSPTTRETCTSSIEPVALPQTRRVRNATTVQDTTRACLWQTRTESLETDSAPNMPV
eukprot:6815049-Alexandrium_andersonii.AAC.1